MIDLNGLDIVCIVLVIFATLRGGIRGFIHEFLSMAAVVVGIGLAVLLSGSAAMFVEPYLGAGPWSQVVAFLGIFVVTYIIVKLFENGLNRLIETIRLQGLDRALGLFLGLAEGLIVVFVVVLLLQLQPLFDARDVLAGSQVAQLMIPLLPYAERIMGSGANA